MEFRELHDVDLTLMNKIVEIEEEAFEGNGNVDLWILKALIRYGKVFVLVEGDEIITIAEYMQVLGKDEVFLYGISTRKKYRNRGNARKIMEESEKYLKRLGYKEVVEYLEGKISKDDMIEKIKQETRRYARRQLTWFRKNKQTIWLDAQDKIQNNIKIILEG